MRFALVKALVLSAASLYAQNALPTLRPPYAPKPADRYYTNQWHLEARNAQGQRSGADHNVRGAWAATKGEGVTVAIVDDGVDLAHPDLAPNAIAALHRNFDNNANDGSHSQTEFYHGTASVGLIAAAQDSTGVSGIAPAAKFASWTVYPSVQDPNRTHIPPEKMANVFQYALQEVQIQCHNWLETIFPEALIPMSPVENAAIQNAIDNGRGGLGIVMTRAAGNQHFIPNHPLNPYNQRNANDDAFSSDPRVITVGATRIDGKVASYSQRGAPVLVAGASGEYPFPYNPAIPSIFTTDATGTKGGNAINFFPPDEDLNNYLFDYLGFWGTSASNPIIAGICALILSENPNLSYRDVQQILIHSARHVDKSDWDLVPNGAGYPVSHRTGFGIPDAAEAVRLAQTWITRPPLILANYPSDIAGAVPIPDTGLRVHVTGLRTVPPAPISYMALPSMGKPADDPTAELPIVDVGLANDPVNIDLTGKAALILRGGANFSQKIANVTAAGAAMAIIYNHSGGDTVNFLGATDDASIPAVSISQNSGLALKNLVETEPGLRVQIRPNPAVAHFQVSDSILAEHIGVRIRTTHQLRGDLRITLVSPKGTRSVLQVLNNDLAPGPIDWTYWSTHHFYEPIAGTWTLEIVDAPVQNTGDLIGADMLVRGVGMIDLDNDGLDDTWELANFTSLSANPTDDPDRDGSPNVRERILGTNPNVNQTSNLVTVTQLQPNVARLTFPSADGQLYHLHGAQDVNAPFARLSTHAGSANETEIILPTSLPHHFYQIADPSRAAQ